MISAHAHFTYITKTDNILHVHSLIAYKKTTNKEFKRCIILSLSLLKGCQHTNRYMSIF